MKKTFLISLTILFSAIGFAQKGQKEEALGVWITIDDETKKTKVFGGNLYETQWKIVW